MEKLLIEVNTRILIDQLHELAIEREVGQIHMKYIDTQIDKINNKINGLKGSHDVVSN